VLEAGAEEVNDLGEHFEVVSGATGLYAERDALREADIEVEDTEQDFRASVEVDLDIDGAKKLEKLIDALEDADDVQNVYTNMTVSDEVAQALANE